ncbi:cupin domain-containing protein [Parvularcula lutaonensis]|uniref:Cupin domain-containing protein n=1 Tax=Parvularcula lutaonensis TaxID=491923 RepID=A0ABV7MA66_9PROT|nr:cupin domain-containing protein [Parvularcula lutaonensis]GGY46306.1 hypothetical protein GCM10007148_14270 [Parvularcula lutaonensis]
MRNWIWLAGAGFASLSVASAESCPAGQEAINRAFEGPSDSRGFSAELLATVGIREDLAPTAAHRIIRITIQPGGYLSMHDHKSAQGGAVILSGTAVEYRSDCKVPVLREPGDVATEHEGLTHWWSNQGDEPLVALVSHTFALPDED